MSSKISVFLYISLWLSVDNHHELFATLPNSQHESANIVEDLQLAQSSWDGTKAPSCQICKYCVRRLANIPLAL